MRILVLTKRQYMAKDLLDDRFGRFRELPLELAKLGHEISGICLSYQSRREEMTIDTDGGSGGSVTWHSLNLGKFIVPGLISYVLRGHKLAKEFNPDLIWACSDAFHVIVGAWLARSLRVKCAADLYDNFEAFAATRLTGIMPLFKRTVRNADGVTCFSQRLAEHVVEHYRPKGLTDVIENGIRTDLFYPRDPVQCRRQLGLPQDAKIIGTAGALYRNRAIETLFRAFKLLAASDENLHLAIAGPRDKQNHVPVGPRVHDLGILPWEQVPVFINALDVAVSCYRDSELGRYSFPQKAYEIIGCKTPLVAAAVGTMNELLAAYPECLFQSDSPENLAQAVRNQLATPTVIDLKVPGWSDSARRLESFFRGLSSGA